LYTPWVSSRKLGYRPPEADRPGNVQISRARPFTIGLLRMKGPPPRANMPEVPWQRPYDILFYTEKKENNPSLRRAFPGKRKKY
jgi:hypothetical protein